jgi:nucleoside-diphosphate-sugar epimerase
MPKVLVAGVSGVVGYAAAKAFAEDPSWTVVGLSRRRPLGLEDIEHVSVDLSDGPSVEQVVRAHPDITHVVYAALFEKPGLIPGWYEADQMETNLAMFRNLMDPLERVATNLQHVVLLQGTKAYGAHVEPMRIPGRERDPRHQHANFYWLQEDDLRARQDAVGGRWSWSIMRPQIIFGEALGSNMNAIPALGVYAALLKEAGEPLHWPGGTAMVTEAVDADLLGRAIKWTCSMTSARNEIFNVTNGDVFCIKHLWPAIADAFGMSAGEERPCSLAAEMPGRESDWARVVERHGLVAPTDLGSFVGQSFIYADVILGYGMDAPLPPAFVSTIKIRRAGFSECMDTEDMFRSWIARLQQRRLLPPR